MPHRRRLAAELTADFVGALLLAVCIFILAVRVSLPRIDAWRDRVEAWAGEAIGQPVRFAAIEAGWRGLDPRVVLDDVVLLGADGTPWLEIESVRAQLDVGALLLRREVRFALLRLDGLDLVTAAPGDGQARAGHDDGAGAGFAAWLLRQPRVDVGGAHVAERAADGTLVPLADFDIGIANDGDTHRFGIRWRLPHDPARGANLDVEFRGDPLRPAAWRGSAHLRAEAFPWRDLLDRLPGAVPPLPGGVPWDRVPEALDGEAWLVLDGGITHAAGDVVLHGAGEAGGKALQALGARFDWRPRPDGWRLDLARLSLSVSGQEPLWLGDAALEIGPDGLTAGLATLPLAPLPALLADGGLPGADYADLLVGLAPRGDLFDLRLRLREDGDVPRWRLRGEALDVAVASRERLPGLDGFTGRFDVGPDGGRVTLGGRALALDLPWLFRDPIAGLRVAGDIDVWRHGAGWRVGSERLEAANDDISTITRLRLDLPDDGDPFLDLVGRYRDGDGSRTRHYLPAGIMGEQTVAWLDRAFGPGRVVDGGVVVHGRLADFPYDGYDGRFQVLFDVADQQLDYLEGWPRFSGIAGRVEFDGRGMHIAASEGRVFGARLHDVVVDVADLTAANPQLVVNGRAAGGLGDGLRYLRESPLRPLFGDYLVVSRGSGPIDLRLALRVPLAGGSTDVEGSVALGGDLLQLPDYGLDIEGIRGRLDFTGTGLSAHGLTGSWERMPVTVDLEVPARHPDGRGGTLIRAFGRLLPETLATTLPPQLAGRLAGETPWRATVRALADEGGGDGEVAEVRVHIDSSLVGLAATLPAPLGKAAATPADLDVDLVLGADRPTRLDARLAGRMALAAMLERRDGRVEVPVATLHLGAGAADLPPVGTPPWRIEGDRLVLADWWPQAGVAGSAGDPAGWLAPPELGFDLAHLELADGVVLGGARGTLTSDEAGVAIDFDSDEAGGRVIVPRAWGPGSEAVVELEHLTLPEAEEDAAPEPAAGMPGDEGLDPRDLPALRLHVRRLVHGGRPVGELVLRSGPSVDGQLLEELLLSGDGWRVDGTGRWRWLDDRQRSALELEFSSGELDTLLQTFGYAGQFEGAPTSATLTLEWPGGPADLSRRVVDGRLEVDVGAGVIREIGPGAGRVFGLLNLGQIGRRVRLDFSDLTDQGLAFDAIHGHFLIDDGNAYTNDLVLTGPAATISVMGRIGLDARDYDELVTVIPEVSGSLPIAGTVLGGPALGAALLVFERLLGEELNKLSRAQYTLTGPWDEPRFERLQSAPAAAPETPGNGP